MERFRGKTITFTFTDGAMANTSYTHTFSDDGGVSYQPAGSGGEGTRAQDCAIEKLREDVWVVAYRGQEGHTLTSVLDFASNRLIAIASNAGELSVHRGTFETARETSEKMDAPDVASLVTPIH